MALDIATPALFFPAISLLLLAYTNRFLALASLIRQLHSTYRQAKAESTLAQIRNLARRVRLIKFMQLLGVCSILFCCITMFLLFIGAFSIAYITFAGAMLLLIASLVLSAWEIHISPNALGLDLQDIACHLPNDDL